MSLKRRLSSEMHGNDYFIKGESLIISISDTGSNGTFRCGIPSTERRKK